MLKRQLDAAFSAVVWLMWWCWSKVALGGLGDLRVSMIPLLELEDRLSKILKALLCNERDLKVILGPPWTMYSSSSAHREELWHDALLDFSILH